MKIFKPHIKSGGAVYDLGTFTLRLFLGGLIMTHGLGKFLRAVEGNLAFADPIGLGPEISIWLVITAELGCAALVILGLFFQPALIVLIFNMIIAAFIHHAADPLAKQELPLLYLGGFLGLYLLGSGRWSLDQARK